MTDVQRLERRLNGLKQAVSQLREQQDSLQEQLAAMSAITQKLSDRLDEHTAQYDRIHTNAGKVDNLDFRLKGKVGMSQFEELAEQVQQMRAQLEFLADAIDTGPEKRELAQ